VSNAQLDARERADQELRARLSDEEAGKHQRNQGIAGHIRQQFYDFRQMRETRGISVRLVEALRTFRGEYPPGVLAEIRKFGGSEVYSRLSALKCRGATAMLRDIYLAGERPWFIEPTPVPTLPEDITTSMLELVNAEVSTAQMAGQTIGQEQMQQRIQQLTRAAQKAANEQAHKEAQTATQFLDDMLVEGDFYNALAEFLHYLTVFPYALVKGPVVKMSTDVKWVEGQASVTDQPKMYWTSPNPFDIFWQTGVRKFEESDVIEHLRLTRSDLNNLLGVPGYDDKAIRGALEQYGNGGLSDWIDYTDTERAQMEAREDPHINLSDMIDTLEFHGTIQGRLLRQYGFEADQVPDEDIDYFCSAWLIDHYLIKVQIDPNPRKRHPYFKTSFEKIPGGTVGYGLPEILTDIQGIANASLRALVNNLSIASGPQVVVNDGRVSPTSDSDALYPWKRWHVDDDPYGSPLPPITFFQPESNSQELLQVYQQMTVIADEISAIPRYMTGSAQVQGAGRTASGLNMLMQNAGKVLQSVAANVDADIFSPLLQKLYDTVLLTDEEDRLRGDEQIRVRGVVFANQKENERTRLLEFMQLTMNPLDSQIVGMEGRAEMLREVADRIGLDHMAIVPDKEQVQEKQRQQQMTQMAQGQLENPIPDEAGAVDEGLKGAARGPSGQV
jgi:hypothetical protein